jgi:hypothetical protein
MITMPATRMYRERRSGARAGISTSQPRLRVDAQPMVEDLVPATLSERFTTSEQ